MNWTGALEAIKEQMLEYVCNNCSYHINDLDLSDNWNIIEVEGEINKQYLRDTGKILKHTYCKIVHKNCGGELIRREVETGEVYS